jgi:hypothetical protein
VDASHFIDANDDNGIVAAALAAMGAAEPRGGATRLGGTCSPGMDMPSMVDLGVSFTKENERSAAVVGGAGSRQLPPGGRKWSTCAVVGNGGHLRKTRYGKPIDAAAAVARINHAPHGEAVQVECSLPLSLKAPGFNSRTCNEILVSSLCFQIQLVPLHHDDRHAGMVGVKTTLRIVTDAAPELTSSHKSSSLKDAPLVYTSTTPSKSSPRASGAMRLDPKLVQRAGDFLFSFRSCLKEMVGLYKVDQFGRPS